MKIELVINNQVIEVIEQDKKDPQIWNLKSGSWLYGNEVTDYIKLFYDNYSEFTVDGIPF